MAEHAPQLARDGIALRKFGQQIIELLGGKRIHPAWVVPGGVSNPLSAEDRATILAMIPEALVQARRTLAWYKEIFGSFEAEIPPSHFPTLFWAWSLRAFYVSANPLVNAVGEIVADQLDPASYQQWLAESVEPDSYLKSPYYRPMDYPDGIFRVGPLARMNIISRCGTEIAEWAEFRSLQRGAVLSSFHYHYARLIEIIYCIERIRNLLNDPDILSDHVRAFAEPNAFEGWACRKPTGHVVALTRLTKTAARQHDYRHGQHNLAMNKGVSQVAKYFVRGEKIQEGMLNRVEAVIRTFDPCLSCSTHAFGQMPLAVQLLSPRANCWTRFARLYSRFCWVARCAGMMGWGGSRPRYSPNSIRPLPPSSATS